ncbi:hypothetical protein [Lacinutrix jangbogonensis]|uniref:hypothetical protein n=1 Tax=Lacinutrix jangbogonensis TaxID=1469557 RepID=UPI00053E7E4C|nr:hypothetical protein [Lacinutrix jangbogonensis]
MKSTKTLITTILILLLLFGCSKDDDNNTFTPTLPEATQTGENTFGCYIDGVLLTPRDGSGTFNSSDRGMKIFSFPPDRLYNEIIINDYASEKTGKIVLHILDLENTQVSNYIVNESNCQDNVDSPLTTNIFCRVYDHSENIYKNYCSYENSGNITISRYDNGIISGIFNARLKNINNNEDEIEITEGRFDINGNTLSETIFP